MIEIIVIIGVIYSSETSYNFPLSKPIPHDDHHQSLPHQTILYTSTCMLSVIDFPR